MDKHFIIQKYISGLSLGLGTSLLISGSAGTGKTETTLTSLKELGLVKDRHYKYLSNYITPLELYCSLKELAEKAESPRILILDDVESILSDKKVVGILKSALWETEKGKREVQWTSGTYRINSKSFNFTGSIIMLVNEFNDKNPLLRAISDRGFFYKMELSTTEIITLIKQRAIEQDYHNIPRNKRCEIADFIATNYHPNLSLRALNKVYNLFILSPQHWRELAKNII